MVLHAHAAGERAWAAMDADGDGKDGDGKMTLDEYVAWVGVEPFDNICSPALGALFDLVDTDEDGALDRPEFIVLHTALGNPAGNAERPSTHRRGRLTRGCGSVSTGTLETSGGE
ncbi:hypothetical protein ABT009_07975 [Streptomyces sp. NPDC002896]|uniref:hypothetical protein n=1 Tax=Streptomyces sp. NPDC002896 TaxID=3154438 RepID=UPI00332892B6